MPTFTRQFQRPPTAATYEAAARRLERDAATLRRLANAVEPRDKATRTSTIHGLSRFAQALSTRHRGHIVDPYVDAPLTGPGSRLQAQLDEIAHAPKD